MAAVLLGALLWGGGLTAAAEDVTAEEMYAEQVTACGADKLLQQLPPETQALLRDWGVDELDADAFTSLSPQTLGAQVCALLQSAAGGVIVSGGTVLGVVIFGALAGGLRQTVRTPEMADTFQLLCTVVACGAILLPMADCVQAVSDTAVGVTVFMLSFIPVYAAVLVCGGQATLATSYSTVLFAGAEGVSALLTGVVTPLLRVSLGISAVGALSEKTRMGALGGFLAKGAGWLLATATGLFAALLSMQSLVAGAADTFGLKAARMSLAGFIPVVGGTLGETLSTVTGCLRLLRSTLGMFGVVAAAALVLPTLCRCVLWAVMLAICRTAAQVLEVKPVAALLAAAGTVMKTLIGVLAACDLFMIVTTTVVTTAGGA